MNLAAFIKMIMRVEYSQHAYKNIDEETGLPVHLEAMIDLINMGVTELHKRFLIKKGVAIAQVCGDRLRYTMEDGADFLLTPDVPLNFLEVLQVFDSSGEPCLIDATQRYRNRGAFRGNERLNIRFVNLKTFEVESCNECLEIIYRKNGDTIPQVEEVAPAEYKLEHYEIDLPSTYLDALIYYTAARIFSTAPVLDGYAAAYSPNLLYRKKFDEECARLELLKLDLEGTGDDQQRFASNMFP